MAKCKPISKEQHSATQNSQPTYLLAGWGILGGVVPKTFGRYQVEEHWLLLELGLFPSLLLLPARIEELSSFHLHCLMFLFISHFQFGVKKAIYMYICK